MTFKKYWCALSADGKRKFAVAAGSQVAYLSNLAHGHRYPSGRKMDAIAAATFGVVSRSSWPPRQPQGEGKYHGAERSRAR